MKQCDSQMKIFCMYRGFLFYLTFHICRVLSIRHVLQLHYTCDMVAICGEKIIIDRCGYTASYFYQYFFCLDLRGFYLPIMIIAAFEHTESPAKW